MKIRHITGLLAAALTLPAALGNTLADASYTMYPTAENESLTLTGISANFYTVLKLDVDAFAQAVSTATPQTTVVSVTGTKDSDTYVVGLATTATAGGLTGQACTAGSGNSVSGTAYPLTANTADDHHIADGLNNIDWGDVTGAALAFAHKGAALSCAFLSIQKSDGTFAEYYGGNTGYRYSSLSPTTFNVNSDLVSAAFVFNGTTDQGNVTRLNHAAIAYVVPEPATATLSLLALAGLAVRRRRK